MATQRRIAIPIVLLLLQAGSCRADDTNTSNAVIVGVFAGIGVAIVAILCCLVWFCGARCCRRCCKRSDDIEAPKLPPRPSAAPPTAPPGPAAWAAPPARVDAAWWSVAIKTPGNKRSQTPQSQCHFVSADSRAASQTSDVMLWISNMLSSQEWGWSLAYNDQPPDGSKPSGVGHCKGLLVWNGRQLGWLVHSTPEWPEPFNIRDRAAGIPGIRRPQLVHGQSFAWVLLPSSMLPQVTAQLQIMQVYVYHCSSPSAWPYLKQAPPSRQPLAPTMLSMGSRHYVSHVAKSGAWGRDLYNDFLASNPAWGGSQPWYAQTWRNAEKGKYSDKESMVDSSHVINVEELSFNAGSTHKSGSDHSKWAISGSSKRLVIIGDLNRVNSQLSRGGGGLIFQSPLLWSFLKGLIVDPYVAEE